MRVLLFLCTMNTTNDQLLARITTNPDIFGGKPIIRGIRFRVVDVIEMMAMGMDKEQILREHPILQPDDITACLLYVVKLFK